MDCTEFRDIVADLARGQARGRTADEPALAHARECEACAMLLAAEERLAASLDVLNVQDEGLQAPAHLENVLLQEFRALNRPKPAAPPRRHMRRSWWAVAAAAAAAVFAVWLGPWREQPLPTSGTIARNIPESARNTPKGAERGREPAPAPSAASVNPAVSLNPAVSGAAERAKAERGWPRPQPVVVRATAAAEAAAKPAPVAAAETAMAAPKQEVVTDFVSLTYGEWTSVAPEARLVRVRLPSTALLYFGLPAAAEAASVEADVVFGEDGLAHAVRFVRPVMASTALADRSSQAPPRY